MPAIRKAIARNGQSATDFLGGTPPVDGGVTGGVDGGVFGVEGVGGGIGGGVGVVVVVGVIEPPSAFVQRSSHGTMPLPFLFNIFFTT